MKVGECVYASTHAELLNELLGRHYKAWMKSSLTLPDGKMLWMIELGDFVSPAGWKNKLVSNTRISEKHVEKGFTYKEHGTYKGGYWPYPMVRVVFDVRKDGYRRKYIFRGVFRLNTEECKLDENIWDLIKDEYTI